ncbi:protein kinase C and casein kinase substrate in neurons protein 2-like isoform X1 [Stegodyphus dumicola]|uniref:protein kinase C and casein kinase substrate in neurons protein 2-like isoform X1 n=1 Tax=Stegodyphus dumicola TaxID=202533 RepID=UPI0015A7F36D|nr:protein kinase C and casein kinase substrate in neurons protein 2-like isoform X1 [Stegodyphus dumicola]XP_035218484.1 protein kinase C and casein kinase substrate in neurons protein 2-like isoform X1 [Stegodyphus dumicola]
MSHHSDDAMLIVGSDSFWEPGNYKRTTKRIEDSFRLCNDLILLIQERSEIEKTYAKSLRNWSKKWNEIIEKGPEYGTTEAAWKAVLIEAERRCDMHLRIKDQLLNDVVTQIKQWQKDNFHKSMIHIKEKKEMDDNFKKAQKPWAKLLARVNKCKADYHQACKNERSAVNQERNASADTSLSPDQVTKLQDRVSKCKLEAQRAKERYEQALQEINDYNAKYMEDMTVVFDKCQEFEEKRLDFFKEMLFSIHGCLNISTDAELPQIYEEYRHSIQNADAKKDLKWWSNNHGVGMAMNWPQFEEYCEEFRDIGKLKKGAVPESGILLVNQQKIGEDLPEYTSDSQNVSKKEKKGTINSDTGIKLRPDKNKNSSNRNSAINFQKLPNNPFEVGENEAFEEKDTNGKEEQNPFDDDQEDWDEGSNDALVDNGEPGVPVRALYDYEGAEADELSFKNGEVFEKLEDEDEQGWCKGRKDGRVGLYPASYVELVAN